MWLFFFNYSSVKNNESVGAYPVPGAGSCHVAHTGVWAHGAGMLCVCVYVGYVRTCAHGLLGKLGMKSVGKIAL